MEHLSERGLQLTQPALPYLANVLKGFSSPFDAHENPDGYILLAVAENKLCWNDILLNRIRRYFEVECAGPPSWSANYGPLHGAPVLREAVAKFLKIKLYQELPHPCPFAFGAEDIVCTAGATAALSNLFYAICSPGDVVLIPAPYYSAFDNDLRAFGHVDREPVHLSAADEYRLTPDLLQAAYDKVTLARGRPPRALLLTNPNNPLGRIMPVDELREVVAWCDSKNDDGRCFDLISDEIYALSCFTEEKRAIDKSSAELGAESFVSLGSILQGDLAAHRAHIIWGISKDFGLSGFRVGVTWSGEPTVRAALVSACAFSSVSGLTAAFVTAMLFDVGWCNAFIAENARRLAKSCRLVEETLDILALPYVAPCSGMFIYVDMSALLPHISSTLDPWLLEEQVYNELADNHKLILTPGAAQHAAYAGCFRICYAFVSFETLQVAMDRLTTYVTGLRARTTPPPAPTQG